LNREGNEGRDREVDTVLVPSLLRSLVLGGINFGLASLAVFATVAFAERWMYLTLGLAGAYIVWTALFILLGGGALHPLVVGPRRGARFFLLFTLSFIAYAVGWIAAYFLVRGTAGEWLGSLFGSVLMALILAAGFGVLRTELARVALVLFVANSIGYFLGSAVNAAIPRPTGMLLWGVLYGVFLGAGMGAALHLAQKARKDGVPSDES
jgi:hypothetical protein